MAKIRMDKYGSFNPVARDFFTCPVCESDRFVYLSPFGGIWCEKCNAQVEIGFTCDGPNKVTVKVLTQHCHAKHWREKFDSAFTTLWESDEELSTWMVYKDGAIKYLNL